jgi:hypothetical protein
MICILMRVDFVAIFSLIVSLDVCGNEDSFVA